MEKVRLAGGVIQDEDGNILLIHRNKNSRIQWETPGGKIEDGESDIQAAMRELKEELGIPVTLHEKIGEGDFGEADRVFYYIWFKASLLDNLDEITLEQGFDDYRFFSLAELIKHKSELSAGTTKLLELYAESLLGGVF